ncbi:hypothetical protein [Glycomyces sp. YM15]|uniref:hypothetical protein n=1 Tax=Glycomyces sp. YM15 TaxID=2800446 RepID=UPI0019643FDE|nr:hypothetical protein [Glycomyces sp. YM15]
MNDTTPPAAATLASAPIERVAAAGRLLASAAGPDRDEQVFEAFSSEVAEVLQPQVLALEPGERAKCWTAVADLADAHLTEAVLLRLPTEQRVRIALARHRDHALLEAAIAEPAPRFLLEDGRLFARYPGFREEPHGLADTWFEAATERVTGRLAKGVEPRYLVWTGVKRAEYRLEYSFFVPVEGCEATSVRVGAVRLAKGETPGKRTAVPAAEDPGFDVEADVAVRAEGPLTAVTASVRTEELTAHGAGRWSLRAHVTLRDFTYDLPLKAPRGYFQRLGMPIGLAVEVGQHRILAVRVDERATWRGLSRLRILDFRK